MDKSDLIDSAILLSSVILVLIFVGYVAAYTINKNSEPLSDIELQDKNMSEQIESHLEDMDIDASVYIYDNNCRVTFIDRFISGGKKYAAIECVLGDMVNYRRGDDVKIFAYTLDGKRGRLVAGMGSYNVTTSEAKIWVPFYKETNGPLND